MPLTRIITFMGLGKREPPYYHPCRYRLDDIITAPTPIHDVAALQRSGPVSLVVLGTEEVRERWFSQTRLYQSELERLGFGHVPLAFVQLPKGRTEEERWEMFNLICSTLDRNSTFPTPEGTPWLEPEVPSALIFDVTHGFRSQSILATAALEFVQSESLRSEQDPLPIRILYAAFEAREPTDGDSVAPVWDLTQLMQAHAWNRAINGLMRYGRADELSGLLSALQRDEVRRLRAADQQGPYPQLARLGTNAASFADALSTAQVPTLLTKNAAALRDQIHTSRADVARLAPPLSPQLDQLAAWATALACEQVISMDGIRAAVALGEVYRQTQRYSELAALLRETAVTLWSIEQHGADVLQPQEPGFNEQRRELDHALGKLSRADAPPSTSPALRLFQQVSELRNDIQHCGFREAPAGVKRLRRRLSEILDTLRRSLDAQDPA